MRSTFVTSIAAVAVLAAGAAPAAARPQVPPSRIEAANRVPAVRSQALQGGLHSETTAGFPGERTQDPRALANSSSLAGTTAPPRPVVTARARVADAGFDWVDAGIGAGLSAALLLGAAGVASARRRPTLPAH